MAKVKVTGVRGSDEVLRPRATVAELQAFLPPASLEDRLRALVVVWQGRARVCAKTSEKLTETAPIIATHQRGVANALDVAVDDLQALLDQYEKEQDDGQAATGK